MSTHSTNPQSAPSTAPTRPRLFLSYGRSDAAPLANRLRDDLEARGFEVWQDTHQIRTGKEWEAEIKDGLRSTQVVVALLSPHAVRRSLDPNSPDNIDSVCLDEISFARFAQPPKPILPVMAVSCVPPFCIFRLDYTDMTQWSQSEDQYRVGFERLLRGLEAALRGEPRHIDAGTTSCRPWTSRPTSTRSGNTLSAGNGSSTKLMPGGVRWDGSG